MLIVLGLVVGILGVFFNLTLVKMQTFYEQLNFLNKRTKIILPFIITGIIGLMYPIVIGSGNRIIEYLNIESAINFLLIVLLVKFILSIICLGSETPGGIFFPTFVIGALIGCIFAYMMIKYGLYSELFFYNFVILAMAGYLTSVFRTPITGIVLIMELTHSFEHWLSVIIVCIVAHIFSQCIYDSSLYEKIIAD
ncbi:H(+)/Cl(-) exchange transporter ClcA [bioreactor metagenome]|uniref:H(+)/Cl(-) exchange transporter ClcA n=1 Tax=bioreactor metagenome TaxID=1076179 RepID=A0A645FJ15_9ZZZZ